MKTLLHSTDKTLIEAAQSGSAEGLVQLTAEKMEELSKTIKARIDEEPKYYQEICDSLTSEQRLAVAAWVMKKNGLVYLTYNAGAKSRFPVVT